MGEKTGIDIRAFAEKVCRAVSKSLGASYQVKLQEVTKNNGVILQGLIILNDSLNVSPTIYLNAFLNAYESGMPLPKIVQKVLEIYRADSPKKDIDMSFFRDFNRVRDRICYRLVNRAKNRALLERIPHIEFLDLCICFYYAYQDSALGAGTILIYNNHAEMWGCSTADLLRLAQKNTPRIYPWEVHSMEEILRELEDRKEIVMPMEEDDLPLPEISMQVLSNSRRVNGAACVLYPGLLDLISAKMDRNYYILPSSVHEVILLGEEGAEDREALRDMVREVNATHVEPEEVLSDNLYYFDRLEGRVRIV